MFGGSLYPTVTDKAAVYCHNIVGNHIFTDGNKRIGLAARLVFLNLNSSDATEFITDDTLTTFILEADYGQSNLKECRPWFAEHTVSL